jgi:hypothetical protein
MKKEAYSCRGKDTQVAYPIISSHEKEDQVCEANLDLEI